MVEKNHDLIITARDCVMTSSKEDVDDLIAFVSEKLQSMSEKGLSSLLEMRVWMCKRYFAGVEQLSVTTLWGLLEILGLQNSIKAD